MGFRLPRFMGIRVPSDMRSPWLSSCRTWVRLIRKLRWQREKQPLGEAGLQGGQGLTVDDALLGAVDQAAPPGALRPYQVAQGEADPETV